jgi:predicted site-specific integrase-resolvase
MDFRRLNISQLSKETNTSRKTLHEWINKGWLQPSQLVGSRFKYTIDSFQEAEKRSFSKNMESLNESKKNSVQIVHGRYSDRISDEWFDNLDEIIEQMDKKTLAEKTEKNPGKRKSKNFLQK